MGRNIVKQNVVVIWNNVIRNDNFAYGYTEMRLESVVVFFL